MSVALKFILYHQDHLPLPSWMILHTCSLLSSHLSSTACLVFRSSIWGCTNNIVWICFSVMWKTVQPSRYHLSFGKCWPLATPYTSWPLATAYTSAHLFRQVLFNVIITNVCKIIALGCKAVHWGLLPGKYELGVAYFWLSMPRMALIDLFSVLECAQNQPEMLIMLCRHHSGPVKLLHIEHWSTQFRIVWMTIVFWTLGLK